MTLLSEETLIAPHTHAIKGLYGITDHQLMNETNIVAMCEQALDGGCNVIQYRNKQVSESSKLRQALALRKLCERHNKTFIVNDIPELAIAVGAHGIHLGQQDMPISQARNIVGNDMIIGATCHASIGLAHTAVNQGANYIAFGRFFPSQTKPNAEPASLKLLTQAAQIFANTPIVAIGGLTFENASNVIDAGAHCIAVCHDLFSRPTPKKQAEALQSLFQTKNRS